MMQLLIIADDFTGALDTGVKLAAGGARTAVVTGPAVDLSRTAPEIQVLVVDAETRHLTAADAYAVVRQIAAQAAALEIPYLYKKTDSALRGNVGAELQAMLDGSGGRQLAFLPALPQMGRCVKKGTLYIGNVPVAQSVFGQDPFEPVTESAVTAIIARQSSIPAISLPPLQQQDPLPEQDGVWVFDASSEGELARTGACLLAAERLHVMAGCAGFAALLPALLQIGNGHPPPRPQLDRRLLVLCGSVNPITRRQLEQADRAGFVHLYITPAQKLTPGYWQTAAGRAQLAAWMDVLRTGRDMLIDSNDPGGNQPTAGYAAAHGLTREDVRIRISRALGQILKELNQCEALGTLLITGGDTLLQCMHEIGVTRMEPVCELAAGVVLSGFLLDGRKRYVISKSGGFGAPDLLTELARRLKQSPWGGENRHEKSGVVCPCPK